MCRIYRRFDRVPGPDVHDDPVTTAGPVPTAEPEAEVVGAGDGAVTRPDRPGRHAAPLPSAFPSETR